MTCTFNLGIKVTPPNRGEYLYLRHHINPTKRFRTDNAQPYSHLCLSRVNVRGLSREIERYDKNATSSSGVRALTFSIRDSFFCVFIFALSMHLHTGWSDYLIGRKILDQIYFYIILISVTLSKLWENMTTHLI